MPRLRRMVHRNEAEGGLMYDPIEVLYDWLDSRGVPKADFEDSLTDLGLIIVPVEESFAPRIRDEDEDG